MIRGIEEYDGRFYPLEPFSGFPSTLAPDNGFANREEAQTFIDNFSQERDPDEQQLLNLYHEIGKTLKDELPGRTNTSIWYEDWLAWENTQIAQSEQGWQSRELTDTQINTIEENFKELLSEIYEEKFVGGHSTVENLFKHGAIAVLSNEFYQIPYESK